MQERFAVGLSLLCAAALLSAALYARWDFATTLVATLAALCGGMLAGRVLGGIGARAVGGLTEPPAPTPSDNATGQATNEAERESAE